jgi:hypothetical protein
VIFADRLYYSWMARLQPLGEAFGSVPISTCGCSARASCGASFLDCVRIGSLLVLFVSRPFIYLVAGHAPVAAVAIRPVQRCPGVNAALATCRVQLLWVRAELVARNALPGRQAAWRRTSCSA